MRFRTFLLLLLCLFLPAIAFAQAPYGGTGTSGTGTGGTSTGSYGSGAAIGIGVGAAAAVGIAILALHGHASMVGCVQSASEGNALVDEKDKRSYSLAGSSMSLKPGQRVEVKGKKTKDSSGNRVFQVQKVARIYGSCNGESAQNAPSPTHQ